MKRTAFAAVAATTLALALAACGHTSDPLGDVSAPSAAGAALGNLKAAGSVHLSGTATDEGYTTKLDITVVRGKGCFGTVQQEGSGKGGYQVRSIGKNVWVKPDEAFLKAQGLTADPTLNGLITGKWIHGTAGDSFGALSDVCDLSATVDSSVGDTAGFKRTGETTLGGQRVVELTEAGDDGKLIISDAARPYPLRLSASESGSGGSLTFDHYNAKVTFTAPAADEVVDAGKLGL